MEFVCNHIDELLPVAEAILAEVPDVRIFLLSGDLGAGKTQLVKAFCKVLKIDEAISSPTFSIVNEYHSNPAGKKVFHMDLYRLEQEFELRDMGFEEYLDQGAYCFIEWPQLGLPILELEDHVKIDIEILGESSRRLNFIK